MDAAVPVDVSILDGARSRVHRFLGSAVGGIGTILAGTVLNGILSNGLLSALPGFTLIAFDPASIAVIILVVMGIAFLPARSRRCLRRGQTRSSRSDTSRSSD